MFGLPCLGCYINDMEEQVVYEVSFGMETDGEVRLKDGVYRCYVTPQYGGAFEEVGFGYNNIEEAIKYLHS